MENEYEYFGLQENTPGNVQQEQIGDPQHSSNHPTTINVSENTQPKVKSKLETIILSSGLTLLIIGPLILVCFYLNIFLSKTLSGHLLFSGIFTVFSGGCSILFLIKKKNVFLALTLVLNSLTILIIFVIILKYSTTDYKAKQPGDDIRQKLLNMILEIIIMLFLIMDSAPKFAEIFHQINLCLKKCKTQN